MGLRKPTSLLRCIAFQRLEHLEMKTPTRPSLHVDDHRLNAEFIARGRASAEEAKRTGEYYSSEDVIQELEDMLAATRAANAS